MFKLHGVSLVFFIVFDALYSILWELNFIMPTLQILGLQFQTIKLAFACNVLLTFFQMMGFLLVNFVMLPVTSKQKQRR